MSRRMTTGQIRQLLEIDAKEGIRDDLQEVIKRLTTVRKKAANIIDLDAPPHIPKDWQFCEEDQLPSRLRGKLLWNPANLKLWLSESQQGRGVIKGHDLLAEIKKLNLPVYPVQVLDFLLEHPDQIPEECKGKFTYFWSPYRYPGGDLCVRYLYWIDGRWLSRWDYLDDDWDGLDPAAVPTSKLILCPARNAIA